MLFRAQRFKNMLANESGIHLYNDFWCNCRVNNYFRYAWTIESANLPSLKMSSFLGVPRFRAGHSLSHMTAFVARATALTTAPTPATAPRTPATALTTAPTPATAPRTPAEMARQHSVSTICLSRSQRRWISCRSVISVYTFLIMNNDIVIK